MYKKFKDFIYQHHWANVIYYLLNGTYHIIKCPVCGHLILDVNICKHCGYEYYYHDKNQIKELKNKYYNK